MRRRRSLKLGAAGVKPKDHEGAITMSDLKDDEIAAFVGKKAGYYLEKWRPVLDGTGNAGNVTGFNWAACLLSGLWLPYRKMSWANPRRQGPWAVRSD